MSIAVLIPPSPPPSAGLLSSQVGEGARPSQEAREGREDATGPRDCQRAPGDVLGKCTFFFFFVARTENMRCALFSVFVFSLPYVLVYMVIHVFWFVSSTAVFVFRVFFTCVSRFVLFLCVCVPSGAIHAYVCYALF